MAADKYLNLEGLSEVANKVNQKLRTVTIMPANPEINDVVLYKGATTGDYTQGSTYMYKLDTTYYAWSDTTDTYYTKAASPQVGDTVYSDTQGTDSGFTIEAYDDTNSQVTINSSVYNRDTAGDVETYSWQCIDTSVTLNGEKKSDANFYAPVNGGNAGQVLVSGGSSSAPIWGSISGYSPSFINDSLVFAYGILPTVDQNSIVFDLDND
jgi:hypothetical protein